MLIEIKHNDCVKIEEFIKLSSLFVREFYSDILPKEQIEKLLLFNNQKTISREIKEKEYAYYMINCENKHIGALALINHNNLIEISMLFLLKKYRKQRLSYKIINEIKEFAIKNKFEKIRIAIVENNKKLPQIITKWGFEKTDFISKYLGDNTYLYQDIYDLRIHVE